MAENIGMTTMMISTTILAAYFVSVLKYHEEINIFCLVGSIFIITGLGKIMLHS
jgi:drug/metabolite transporter (DMT)-like permease